MNAPPAAFNDYRGLQIKLAQLRDDEVWVLRCLARTRSKSPSLRIFDVRTLAWLPTIAQVGVVALVLDSLAEKGYLELRRGRASTTPDGNVMKHMLQAVDEELRLFGSASAFEPWRARVQRYRDEVARRAGEHRSPSA